MELNLGVVAKEGILLLQGLSGLVRDEIHYINNNFLRIRKFLLCENSWFHGGIRNRNLGIKYNFTVFSKIYRSWCFSIFKKAGQTMRQWCLSWKSAKLPYTYPEIVRFATRTISTETESLLSTGLTSTLSLKNKTQSTLKPFHLPTFYLPIYLVMLLNK